MAPCDGSSRQQFGYTADLYLKMINSESSAASSGMCLWASDARKAGTALVFRPCPAVRTTTFQWALDGASQFHSTIHRQQVGRQLLHQRGVPPARPRTGPWCSAPAPATTPLTIWRSATGVGAGMAGDSTNQLVNYAQFSRCLDVTSKNMGSSYMIAWFCKQDPGALVDFNQQWGAPDAGGPGGQRDRADHREQRDGETATARTAPAHQQLLPEVAGVVSATSWVTVVTCATAALQLQTNLQWTVYHDTGDYGMSYRIKDYMGNCLQPTDQNSGVANDFHGDGTSKVKVSVCNTSELQKWNAPANISQPTPLVDLTEK